MMTTKFGQAFEIDCNARFGGASWEIGTKIRLYDCTTSAKNETGFLWWSPHYESSLFWMVATTLVVA